MALREIGLQNHVPRKPDVTYDEAIYMMDEPWTRLYEAMDFPIRDLLSGRRWFVRFNDSSQLEVMLHQILCFVDEQRENWTPAQNGRLDGIGGGDRNKYSSFGFFHRVR